MARMTQSQHIDPPHLTEECQQAMPMVKMLNRALAGLAAAAVFALLAPSAQAEGDNVTPGSAAKAPHTAPRL